MANVCIVLLPFLLAFRSSFGAAPAARKCPRESLPCAGFESTWKAKVASRFRCEPGAPLETLDPTAQRELGRQQYNGAFLDDYLGGPRKTTSTTSRATTSEPPLSSSVSTSTPTMETTTTQETYRDWVLSPLEITEDGRPYKKAYKVFNPDPERNHTFEEAEQQCQQHKGHLVSLATYKEHMFLINDVLMPAIGHLAEGQLEVYWIGLTVDWVIRDKADAYSATFNWTDGTEANNAYVLTEPGLLYRFMSDHWPWVYWQPAEGKLNVDANRCGFMVGWAVQGPLLTNEMHVGQWELGPCDRTLYVRFSPQRARFGFICKARKYLADGALGH